MVSYRVEGGKDDENDKTRYKGKEKQRRSQSVRFSRFSLFRFDGDSGTLYILREAVKMKRQEVEKKLVKQLFWNIVKNEKIDRQGLSVSIDNRTSFSHCYSYFDGSYKITLSIAGAKIRIKEGYTDCYYQGRKELLAKYTLHNLHNEIRFLIYHELKHSIDRSNNKDYNRWPERRREYQADSYALSKLKRSRRADWNE